MASRSSTCEVSELRRQRPHSLTTVAPLALGESVTPRTESVFPTRGAPGGWCHPWDDPTITPSCEPTQRRSSAGRRAALSSWAPPGGHRSPPRRRRLPHSGRIAPPENAPEPLQRDFHTQAGPGWAEPRFRYGAKYCVRFVKSDGSRGLPGVQNTARGTRPSSCRRPFAPSETRSIDQGAPVPAFHQRSQSAPVEKGRRGSCP